MSKNAGRSTQFTLSSLFLLNGICGLGAAFIRLLMSLPGWEDHLRSSHCVFAVCLVVTSLCLWVMVRFTQTDQPRFGRAYAVVFVLVCIALIAWYKIGKAPAGFDSIVVFLAFAVSLLAMSPVVRVTGRFTQVEQARITRAYAALFTVVFLLVSSALVSWYTLGEVFACLMMFAVLLAFVPGTLCAVGEYRASFAASIVVILFTAPTICVPQCVLVWRLKALQAEVRAIATYVDSEKQSSGAYPADLSDYRFVRPHLRPLVTYLSPESLAADYYIVGVDLFEGGDGLTREYSSQSGWYYYPD